MKHLLCASDQNLNSLFFFFWLFEKEVKRVTLRADVTAVVVVNTELQLGLSNAILCIEEVSCPMKVTLP